MRRTRRLRGRYPPRRMAGLTVSRCRTRGLSANDRIAAEARARSPSLVSAFQAERERWNGIRTRDRMIKTHLLYQLSYPRMVSNWTGSTLPFVRRNTELHSNRASRVSASPDTWPSEGSPHVIEIVRPGKQNDAQPTKEHGYLKLEQVSVAVRIQVLTQLHRSGVVDYNGSLFRRNAVSSALRPPALSSIAARGIMAVVRLS